MLHTPSCPITGASLPEPLSDQIRRFVEREFKSPISIWSRRGSLDPQSLEDQATRIHPLFRCSSAFI